MRHDIDKGLQAGFFRYLSKPIKMDAFTEALDAALDLADRPEQAPARAVVAESALTASSATSAKNSENSKKVQTP
jgi:response regulator of citrate/malate metabolism